MWSNISLHNKKIRHKGRKRKKGKGESQSDRDKNKSDGPNRMNKRIHDHNERKSDIGDKKRQKNNGREDNSDRNESEGIIHNEMNAYNKGKVRKHRMKGRKEKKNVWNKSNNKVEKSEERNGEWS